MLRIGSALGCIGWLGGLGVELTLYCRVPCFSAHTSRLCMEDALNDPTLQTVGEKVKAMSQHQM